MNDRGKFVSMIDDGTRACNPATMKIGDDIETLEKQQNEITGLINEIKYRLDELPLNEPSDLKNGCGYLLRLNAMTNKNSDLIQALMNILEIL